jgi:hypothetical protein
MLAGHRRIRLALQMPCPLRARSNDRARPRYRWRRALERHNSKGASYYPSVKFKTKDGHTVRFRDRVGPNAPTFSVGDNVTVLYLPSGPRRGRHRSRCLELVTVDGRVSIGLDIERRWGTAAAIQSALGIVRTRDLTPD